MTRPADLKYSPSHEWARIEDGTVTVGITAALGCTAGGGKAILPCQEVVTVDVTVAIEVTGKID